MNKLEKTIELLGNIKTGSNGYRLGENDMEYILTVTKDLRPGKITKIEKVDTFWKTEYKVYFRNNVNFKKLDEVCKDKGYRGKECKEHFINGGNENFIIGYFGEIFAEENFISFIPKYKKKALDIIEAYLKSNGGK